MVNFTTKNHNFAPSIVIFKMTLFCFQPYFLTTTRDLYKVSCEYISFICKNDSLLATGPGTQTYNMAQLQAKLPDPVVVSFLLGASASFPNMLTLTFKSACQHFLLLLSVVSSKPGTSLWLFFFFFERGEEGRKREGHWCKTETSICCLPNMPWAAVELATQSCALTGIELLTFLFAGGCLTN